jgi:hypothetical protein
VATPVAIAVKKTIKDTGSLPRSMVKSLGLAVRRQRRPSFIRGAVVFSFQPRGFTNSEMRVLLAQLLGLDPANYPAGS